MGRTSVVRAEVHGSASARRAGRPRCPRRFRWRARTSASAAGCPRGRSSWPHRPAGRRRRSVVRCGTPRPAASRTRYRARPASSRSGRRAPTSARAGESGPTPRGCRLGAGRTGSFTGVKIRARTSPSFSGGSMNVVSDRLSSRARRCISSADRSAASRKAATGVSCKGMSVKTSTIRYRCTWRRSDRTGQTGQCGVRPRTVPVGQFD